MNANPILILCSDEFPAEFSCLTVGSGTRATGMLASWVMQAGFEPPMVTVAVKKGRYVEDWITRGDPFNLNLVGENSSTCSNISAKASSQARPAFEGINIRHCARAVPILTDCLGHFECEPVSHLIRVIIAFFWRRSSAAGFRAKPTDDSFARVARIIRHT